jgi:AAA+ superfamily predicted ATPase
MHDSLVEHRGIVLLCATDASSMASHRDVHEIAFDVPSASRRRALWREALTRLGAPTSNATLDTIAKRFRLTPRQIRSAATAAVRDARWQAVDAVSPSHSPQSPESRSDASPLEGELVFRAARRQCGRELASLAARLAPRHRWGDLVLPEDARLQLREICERVAHRETVVERWGFGNRLTRGGGVNALFRGPSGTGKTMAAEVMAGALGVDLFRIDLASIVSKYIGETEKNLDRVFTAAEHANGIVFFDEADALFGKRSEVHDSHDRYANIEISYLLQKMEQFEGIAILATNLRGNMDDAFVRRLAFSVHFPFPDAAHRERIWRGIWPAEAPVDPDLDLALLARRFELSGGNIKNIAVAAAFLAAERGGRVEMCDVLHATQREYQKLGKTLTAAELTS